MNFLKPEESKVAARQYPDVDFEFSYFIYDGNINDIRIKRTDLDDVKPHMKALYMRTAPAVPDDFETQITKKIEETPAEYRELKPQEKMRRIYDGSGDKAISMGADEYDRDDFLPYKVCHVLWKLNYKSKYMTGWAYYNIRSKGISSSVKKIATAPILRPMYEDGYTSKVYDWEYSAPAYPKSEYRNLDVPQLSAFQVNKLNLDEIRILLLRILEGKEATLNTVFVYLSHTGAKKSVIVHYLPRLKTIVDNITDSLLKLTLFFPVESYIRDNGVFMELPEDKANDLLNDVEHVLLSQGEEAPTSGGGDLNVSSSDGDWNAKSIFNL